VFPVRIQRDGASTERSQHPDQVSKMQERVKTKLKPWCVTRVSKEPRLIWSRTTSVISQCQCRRHQKVGGSGEQSSRDDDCHWTLDLTAGVTPKQHR
jgi:hypothetical protein